MTTFKALVTPNLGFRVLAGNCLAMAQGIVGAPIMHPSATVAANNTVYRHYEREMPNAICVVWLDHWGNYGMPGQEVYANWGHVVVYIPGYGFASSSPVPGEVSGPYFYDSLSAVERAFAASYRFWTEDINGKRVCAPEEVKPIAWEDTMKFFSNRAKRKKKQVIPAGALKYVHLDDKASVTFATGPGDIVGVSATTRVAGKHNGRVQVTAVLDTVVGGKTTTSEIVAQGRAIFDSLGKVGVNLTISTPIKNNQRVRVTVQGSKDAGNLTVERFEVMGYARPGK